jgi:hypothetical protein
MVGRSTWRCDAAPRLSADLPLTRTAIRWTGLAASPGTITGSPSRGVSAKTSASWAGGGSAGMYDQIRHARRHLKQWMRRRPVTSSWFLSPGPPSASTSRSASSVSSAWNYQLLLAVGPSSTHRGGEPRHAQAVGDHSAIGGGDRPHRCPRVPARVRDLRDRRRGRGEHFSTVAFDHLFFTGSTKSGSSLCRPRRRTSRP